jgi:hypothetical protein
MTAAFSATSVLRAVAAAITVCVALGGMAVAILSAFPSGNNLVSDPIDFLAFDCAASVSLHANPYLAEPLRSCEAAALAESHIKIVPNLVVPAPLPPYALALFAPLALLPFRIASALWAASIILWVSVAVVLVRKLSGAPLIAVAVVLLAADAGASILVGQIVPLVLCALCGAALALQSDRPRTAAWLSLATLLEPHVGVAVVASLFAYEPRARRSLLSGAALLAALCVLAGGPVRSIEYLRDALPGQALNEGLEFGGQYSLSAVLAVLGAGSGTALALGSASYVVMLVAGLWLAGRTEAATQDRAFILLVPAALVLIGGAYVHIAQMAFALPLLFALVTKRRRPILALAALCLLAVPWQTIAELPGHGGGWQHSRVVAAEHAMARVSSGSLSASTAWGVWIRSGAIDSRTTAERFAWKLPTWFGLVLMFGEVLVVARPSRALRPAGYKAAPA